jgi:hypothetical protein
MIRRRSNVAATVLGAALVGVAGGWVLSRWLHRINREELFDQSAWRRMAALGWLERHGSESAVPLVRDYLAWEPQAALRAKAALVLRKLEAAA